MNFSYVIDYAVLDWYPFASLSFYHSVKANPSSKKGKDVDLLWTAKDNNTIAEREKSITLQRDGHGLFVCYLKNEGGLLLKIIY